MPTSNKKPMSAREAAMPRASKVKRTKTVAAPKVPETPVITGESIVAQNAATQQWLRRPENAKHLKMHADRGDKKLHKLNEASGGMVPHGLGAANAKTSPAYWPDGGPEHAHIAYKLDNGKITPQDLYRSYKHTPHSPPSVFLKYIVHRVNNFQDYGDPSKAHKLDKDFLKLAQTGGASSKNGHLIARDLHEWMKQNRHAVQGVINYRDDLRQDILKGVGLNVRDINGKKHVALSRGLNSEIMSKEHPLSSWAHLKETGFGTTQHHAWVPLDDIWFSYNHFSDKHYGENGPGHEDEWLVSNTKPRYEAQKHDVQKTRLERLSPSVIPNDRKDRNTLTHLMSDSMTDDELADIFTKHGVLGRISQPIEGYDASRSIFNADLSIDQLRGAGPKTHQAVREAYQESPGFLNEVSGHLQSSLVPADVAKDVIKRRIDGAVNISAMSTLDNPNLSTQDLHDIVDYLHSNKNRIHGIHDQVYDTVLSHPAATSETADKVWNDHLRGKIPLEKQDRLLIELSHSRLTTGKTLDSLVDHVLSGAPGVVWEVHPGMLLHNPNLTTAQTDKILDYSKKNSFKNISGELLLERGNLSPKTITDVVGEAVDKNVGGIASKYLHNPHQTDEGFNALWNSLPNHARQREAQVASVELKYKDFAFPASLQHYIANSSDDTEREREMMVTYHRQPLDPDVVKSLALDPVERIRSRLYHRKDISPQDLEAAWPKGTPMPTKEEANDKFAPLHSEVLYDLARAIYDRREHEQRKAKEHLIKPLPSNLAKSESDAMWQAEVEHWLSAVQSDKGYLMILTPGQAHQAMQSESLTPDFSTEVIDGQAIVAYPSSPHNHKRLKDELAYDGVIFQFKTGQDAQFLPDGRAYWTNAIPIGYSRVLDIGDASGHEDGIENPGWETESVPISHNAVMSNARQSNG